MASKRIETIVAGRKYEHWADFSHIGTYAQDMETKEVRRICGGGYLSNDLTVRKAIAGAFGLPTFRKNAPKQ